MKKAICILGVILIVGVSFLVIKNNKEEKTNIKKDDPEINENEEVNENDNEIDNVLKTLESMSLEEKISQMVIISINVSSLNEDVSNLIKSYKPGGVILFKNNITDYENTTKLVSDINNLLEIKPFIATDQEGGLVQRIKDIENVTTIPDMIKVGKTENLEIGKNIGTIIGKELRTFGVNMDFAPVIDVLDSMGNYIIGERSFGTDPKLVSNMGLSVSSSMISEGVIPVYKHFPGHGSVSSDSHYDLPIQYKTKEELLNSDLIPFIDAINNNAEVIMIGHIAVKNLDDSLKPASLSKNVITDLLKNELGYKGLVITDALNMGAITNNYSEKEIYELAINAGVDILLMPSSIESAVSLIKESINEGTISIDRINESVEKILRLKEKLPNDILSKEELNKEEYKNLVKETLNLIG